MQVAVQHAQSLRLLTLHKLIRLPVMWEEMADKHKLEAAGHFNPVLWKKVQDLVMEVDVIPAGSIQPLSHLTVYFHALPGSTL